VARQKKASQKVSSAPIDLRCEYRVDPPCIDALHPRLFWKFSPNGRGQRQTAYQILAASSLKNLSANKGDLWDSGKVESDHSIQIEYAGKLLSSGQRVEWKVRVWDAAGKASVYSAPASWEMGLLQAADWKAQWIGSTVVGGPRTAAPAPYLRKTFNLNKKVHRARLYVTALGIYECYLNGQRIGDEVFRPGWTEYTRRVQYDAYDLTSQLQRGDNVLGAILGDGWYCGQVQALDRQFYGDRPRFLAQLHLEFADGSSRVMVTDSTWKTSTGPILAGDMMQGESYDARREMPGWNAPNFDDRQWSRAIEFADSGIPRVACPGPAVRCVAQIVPIAPPKKADYPLDWHYRGLLCDLGQNMVGRVRIHVRGKAGQTIRLRHGEVLDKDGALYRANLRSAGAIDFYTLKSDDFETWEPRFTFHGFRYVEIASHQDFELAKDGVVGIVLQSDTPLTGAFECSDPLINQLQKNIQWGQRGNFLEIPTDCPQRDERLGWMGDAQVFVRTAAFNMDVAGFFTKWQTDIADAQGQDGAFPPVCPNAPTGIANDGGPAWADAGIICPWTIHLCFADRRLLAQHYQSFVRFVNFLQQSSHDLIRCAADYSGFPGFGDWLALDGSGIVQGGTPRDLIGTAFFAYSARLLSRIANVLGKDEDARKYQALFEQVRRAFVRRYITPAGLMAAQTQTAYVLALHFDLMPQELRAAAAAALVQDIKKRKNHLSTGFVGTPYLCHVLTQAGYADVAFDLLHQKTWPSWLYSVTQGATTIWERWDGWTHDKGFQDVGMNSFNHYAYGAIGAWLYQCVAGIDIDPEKPAYEHILLRPLPGGGLTHAKASLNSIRGLITSAWRKDKKRFTWTVQVPPNTTATAYVPTQDGRVLEGGQSADHAAGVLSAKAEPGVLVLELASGQYVFTSMVA